jgi:hypothetical protein
MLLAIYANEDAIMHITADGGIAVVVFEATGDAEGLAITLGWDCLAPVFPLSHAGRVGFAATGDRVMARWLSRQSAERRVLLLALQGSMLLNGDDDGNWWKEPGQLDMEVV